MYLPDVGILFRCTCPSIWRRFSSCWPIEVTRFSASRIESSWPWRISSAFHPKSVQDDRPRPKSNLFLITTLVSGAEISMGFAVLCDTCFETTGVSFI